jgi:ABC-type multidrug transport system ATPase subunit
MSWVRTYAKVDFFQSAWPVLAFLVTVLIVLRAKGETGAEELALIPVLIFALPRIFGSVTQLLTLRIKLQIANNSIARIVEYEKEGLAAIDRRDEDDAPARVEGALEVDEVTYQYMSAEGEPQGGVSEVSTAFEPGSWSAIVGGAGSGKSTLINLALGRLIPQSGEVRIGEHVIGESGGDLVPRVATLMPQRVVLLDTSIRANLLIGRREIDDDAILDDDDLGVIEGVGLGRICRLKALEMRPVGTSRALAGTELSALRRSARDGAAGLGLTLSPFEEHHVDPRRFALDALIGGRSDPDRALTILFDRERPKWLVHLSETPLADELTERALGVIDQSRNLLEIEEYARFAELAPDRLDQRIWQIRRHCLGAAADGSTARADRLRLIRVGLTCSPSDWGASQEEADRWADQVRRSHAEGIAVVRQVARPCFEDFDLERIHPFLNWRDNLLLGSVALRNQRQRRRLDAALLELMEDARWSSYFVEQGLEFEVGRNGSQLSGGQGQLVALSRALLRRTPILVLDEPTSALDPASRDGVAAFLRDWRRERVVISISHDPELTRSADEVHVMASGRLAGRGSFDELAQGNEEFQNVFRLKKG